MDKLKNITEEFLNVFQQTGGKKRSECYGQWIHTIMHRDEWSRTS